VKRKGEINDKEKASRVKREKSAKRGEKSDKAKSERKARRSREPREPPTMLVSAIDAGKFRKNRIIVKKAKNGARVWKKGLDVAPFFCYLSARRRKTVDGERNFGDASEKRR